jgi:hypothetical protein
MPGTFKLTASTQGKSIEGNPADWIYGIVMAAAYFVHSEKDSYRY